ncbi:putative F-box domain-containing protein [Rosa chinensis]|uniref:Putative F-box domain-containing protein n=1 Tax=Rosa chinensis TaxID=74649 RepID=A0A2P6PAD0_ROSCH|nr:putative F-box domain-containing protein [Rosa chinensis]
MFPSLNSASTSFYRLPMANNDLPDDIIVKILTRLPVKSLVRFRCVSKTVAFYTVRVPVCQIPFSTSLRAENPQSQTPRLRSSVRQLACPLQQFGKRVLLLGSCNGLVFIGLENCKHFSIWNPLLGLLHNLPAPGFSTKENSNVSLYYHGFAYVSVTDDYKVIVAADFGDEVEVEVEIFSMRANIWKRIEAPIESVIQGEGVLLNEALHWLDDLNVPEPVIFAFDLVKEEFRKIQLPNFDGDGKDFRRLEVVYGGRLLVSRCTSCARNTYHYIDFWVMEEYGVCQSWTMLFDYGVSQNPGYWSLIPILVMETITLTVQMTCRADILVKHDHKEGKLSFHFLDRYKWHMIKYEESLLWLSDYYAVEEKVKRLKTEHKS